LRARSCLRLKTTPGDPSDPRAMFPLRRATGSRLRPSNFWVTYDTALYLRDRPLSGDPEDVTDFCHPGEFTLRARSLTIDAGNSYRNDRNRAQPRTPAGLYS